MGPTNIALVRLLQVDQQLRQAQERLDSASRTVRLQERKLNELGERLKLAQNPLREQQSKSANMELEIKAHDDRIERLRTQQQTASNNKEYQTFLTEINTAKLDKGKIEDELMKVMEQSEQAQAEVKQLSAQIEQETQKHAANKKQLAGRLGELQAEIDRLKPVREEAASAVTPKARDAFERMADRYDGEAMAPLGKPDRRREEYICMSCNMSLVVDVYNRLHMRDELVFCTNCHRILYIPDELPPEMAIHKSRKSEKVEKPERAERVEKKDVAQPPT